MRARDAARRDFLARAGWGDASCRPLAGDASFRHYFRVKGSGEGAVLMDAPPGKEDVRRFLRMAEVLTEWGYSAPRIMASDAQQGFVLLEDIGDDSFNDVIAAGGDERALYEAAVDLLADLHRRTPPEDLPLFDAARIENETDRFLDWTLPALTGTLASPAQYEEFHALWRALAPLMTAVAATTVLFDYHADNLHWLPARGGLYRVGLLDFQDAVRGPAALDLVSLLEDARRDVTPELAQAMMERYLAAAAVSDAEAFRATYAAAGAQRNTRIIGVFARLWLRDGKAGYLELLPRVWRLLENDLAHPALAQLRDWFDRTVPGAQRHSAPDPATFKLPDRQAANR